VGASSGLNVTAAVKVCYLNSPTTQYSDIFGDIKLSNMKSCGIIPALFGRWTVEIWGDGLIHQKGVNGITVSGIGCRRPWMALGRLFLLFSTNGLRKQSSGL